MGDQSFDDGRLPQAATLVTKDMPPLPDIVYAIERPTVTEEGSGIWWLATEFPSCTLVEDVLRMAAEFCLLPVIMRASVVVTEDVELMSTSRVYIVSQNDASDHTSPAARSLRECLRALTAGADTERERLLARCVVSLADLKAVASSVGEIEVDLALIRFTHRAQPEGRPKRRVHPAILIDGVDEPSPTGVPNSASDGAEHSGPDMAG